MLPYVYDIAMLILLFAAAFGGARRGLLYSVVRFAGWFITLALAFLLVGPLTASAVEWSIFQRPANAIAAFIGRGAASVGDGLSRTLSIVMPDKWARSVMAHAAAGSDGVVERAADVTTRLFVGAVVFIVAVIALGFLTTVVARRLSRTLNRVPVVGWLNRSGGFVLGLVIGLFGVWLVTMLVTALAIRSPGIREIVSGSFTARLFAEKDIFRSLLDTIF